MDGGKHIFLVELLRSVDNTNYGTKWKQKTEKYVVKFRRGEHILCLAVGRD